MIEVKNLSVKYGSLKAAENISFCAKSGEITVLMGKNGSGKTTVLKAMDRLIPYDGKIIYDGRCNIGRNELSKTVAYMAQNIQIPCISGEELTKLGRTPYVGIMGILNAEDRRIVAEAIRECGIEDTAGKLLTEMSGGERKKALFAMILAQRAKFLLLDEPCAHLDAEYIKTITEILKKRRNMGDCIVLSLHDINHAMDLADRIIYLDKGKIVFDGTVQEGVESKIPQEMFGLKKYVCKDCTGREEIFYK